MVDTPSRYDPKVYSEPPTLLAMTSDKPLKVLISSFYSLAQMSCLKKVENKMKYVFLSNLTGLEFVSVWLIKNSCYLNRSSMVYFGKPEQSNSSDYFVTSSDSLVWTKSRVTQQIFKILSVMSAWPKVLGIFSLGLMC